MSDIWDEAEAIDLPRLRALHEAATPPPWGAYVAVHATIGDGMSEADMDLIDAMRNSLPALLATAEHAGFWGRAASRLQGELREMTAERDEWKSRAEAPDLVPTFFTPLDHTGEHDELCTVCEQVVPEAHTYHECARGSAGRATGAQMEIQEMVRLCPVSQTEEHACDGNREIIEAQVARCATLETAARDVLEAYGPDGLSGHSVWDALFKALGPRQETTEGTAQRDSTPMGSGYGAKERADKGAPGPGATCEECDAARLAIESAGIFGSTIAGTITDLNTALEAAEAARDSEERRRVNAERLLADTEARVRALEASGEEDLRQRARDEVWFLETFKPQRDALVEAARPAVDALMRLAGIMAEYGEPDAQMTYEREHDELVKALAPWPNCTTCGGDPEWAFGAECPTCRGKAPKVAR